MNDYVKTRIDKAANVTTTLSECIAPSCRGKGHILSIKPKSNLLFCEKCNTFYKRCSSNQCPGVINFYSAHFCRHCGESVDNSLLDKNPAMLEADSTSQQSAIDLNENRTDGKRPTFKDVFSMQLPYFDKNELLLPSNMRQSVIREYNGTIYWSHPKFGIFCKHPWRNQPINIDVCRYTGKRENIVNIFDAVPFRDYLIFVSTKHLVYYNTVTGEIDEDSHPTLIGNFIQSPVVIKNMLILFTHTPKEKQIRIFKIHLNLDGNGKIVETVAEEESTDRIIGTCMMKPVEVEENRYLILSDLSATEIRKDIFSEQISITPLTNSATKHAIFDRKCAFLRNNFQYDSKTQSFIICSPVTESDGQVIYTLNRLLWSDINDGIIDRSDKVLSGSENSMHISPFPFVFVPKAPLIIFKIQSKIFYQNNSHHEHKTTHIGENINLSENFSHYYENGYLVTINSHEDTYELLIYSVSSNRVDWLSQYKLGGYTPISSPFIFNNAIYLVVNDLYKNQPILQRLDLPNIQRPL